MGTLVPAWSNVFCLPRARATVCMDAEWFPGSAIMEPGTIAGELAFRLPFSLGKRRMPKDTAEGATSCRLPLVLYPRVIIEY